MLTAISQARLDEVHPLLKERAIHVSEQFEINFPDFTIQVSQGLRSLNYQAALYAQGRKTLDAVNEMRRAVGLAPLTNEENRIVTDAPAGESNHCFGYAIDWDIQAADGTLDWNASGPRWVKLVALAAPNGLRSGACWRDRPHMELAEVPEVPTPEMVYTLKSQGLLACWQESGLPAADVPQAT